MEKKITPLLIDEDRINYQADLHRINYYLKPYFPKIERAFARLNLGPLTDEYLKDILFNNCEDVGRAIADKVRKEVPNQYLQPAAREKAIADISQLEDVLHSIDHTTDHYAITSNLRDCLSVNNKGKIVLTEKAKADLLESHRAYLYSEQGQTRYKAQLKASKAIQAFVDAMDGTVSPTNALDYFDVDDNDKVFPVVLNCYE